MTNAALVEKLIKRYKNLKAELEMAYEHNLSYHIINALHHDIHKLTKVLNKYGVL